MRLFCILLVSSAIAQTLPPASSIPTPEIPAVSIPQASLRDPLEKQKASIARQQISIRRQAEGAGAHMLPTEIPPPPCDALDEAAVAPMIETAAKAQGLAAELIRAVIQQESGFKPCAVSRKGALGLMQLMPATAEQSGLSNVFDPAGNIGAGAKYLKQLVDRYGGDLAKALGAYNSGPATVDQAGGMPNISETRDYVDSILKKLDVRRTVPPSSPTPKPTGN